MSAKETVPKMAPAFAPNWAGRLCWVIAACYVVYAVGYLEISLPRVLAGFGNGKEFLLEMVPPNYSRWKLLVENLVETVQIAVMA